MNWIEATTEKPPKNTLVLAWYEGCEWHSGASFVRHGYGFAVWHERAWASRWIDDAKDRLGADFLDITHWCELTPPSKER